MQGICSRIAAESYGIIFCVDNKYIVSMRQHNISLHFGKQLVLESSSCQAICEALADSSGVFTIVFNKNFSYKNGTYAVRQKIHYFRSTIRLCL